MTSPKYPHVEKASRYIDAVLSGQIPACKWIKLACQRQAKDLRKKYGPRRWPYEFDQERAEKICNFIELLPHVKGEWAGKPIKLEDWQCFYLTTKYGWVHKESRHRRFTSSFLEVPRKNAKSTLSAGEMLYMASADGEVGAECYSAATTKDQARIVFNTAKKMVEKSAAFREKYQARALKNEITIGVTDSTCAPVSAEAKNLDGLNVHFGNIDELHAHKTRAVYDVIETACGARTQPFLSVITTAGTDITGICYELQKYLEKILDNVFPDDSFFGLIYTIDDDDDWTQESSWIKANPNWGISVKPKFVAGLARKAQRSTASQANFKTKHLDIWEKSNSAWVSLQKWNRCKGLITPRPTLDDLAGADCWLGLDASTKLDVTALMLLFKIDGIWLPYGKYYLPQDTVEERAQTTYDHYSAWAKEGKFILIPGEVIDFDYIIDDIVEITEKFNVCSIGYDAWQADYLGQKLIKKNLPAVEVAPWVKNFSEPMKLLEAWIVAREIDHGDDPVLTWMISNVVAHLDRKDNIYPNKERFEDKIDGVIALIIAIARAILHEDAYESVYNTRGIVTV